MPEFRPPIPFEQSPEMNRLRLKIAGDRKALREKEDELRRLVQEAYAAAGLRRGAFAALCSPYDYPSCKTRVMEIVGIQTSETGYTMSLTGRPYRADGQPKLTRHELYGPLHILKAETYAEAVAEAAEYLACQK